MSHVHVTQSMSHSWTVAGQPPLSMEFSRQEYWSGFYSLIKGIFTTQGSNLGLLNCRQFFYHLSHQGSPMASLHNYRQKVFERLI